MIFLGFSEIKCVSVVTCKIRRAFSIEGSFNKINKFIFNLSKRKSSVKSRKIIRRQTRRIEISSLSLSQISPKFLIDQNRFLPDLSYTFSKFLIACFLTAVRHEVDNLVSSVAVQELELAIKLTLKGFYGV